ncbi:hypothetical protein EA58_13940 [Photobacterium galatheae]|uniref:Flagellar basal-body/hook protein C-terminal domain-containing protein n=2 Tax=Photobacterium galatheae TaxID=1654360 RepID=A0A066RT37_9GAMM|nr:hypothetical protein EA58_13940 [Photobacterium galatheae]
MSAAKQYGLLHEVNTNNVANANTNGFKQGRVSFKALYLNGGDAIRSTSFTELNNVSIDLTSGPLAFTGNNAHLAISGSGFFELADLEGNRYYRRTLTVMKNADGILINADGGKIIGEDGKDIDIGDAPFKADPAGNVIVMAGEATQINGRLKVVELDPTSVFQRSSGEISVDQETPLLPAKEYTIAQGYQEASNVNSVQAMATLVETQKNYDMAAKTMGTIKAMHKTSNSILE